MLMHISYMNIDLCIVYLQCNKELLLDASHTGSKDIPGRCPSEPTEKEQR